MTETRAAPRPQRTRLFYADRVRMQCKVKGGDKWGCGMQDAVKVEDVHIR